MARVILGKNCKLHRNTGTEGSPTWNEIPNCRDLGLNLAYDEADVSVRGVGVKLAEPTLLDAPIEFEQVRDADDTDQLALMTAFLARTALDILVCEGDPSAGGTKGWRGYYKVFNNNQNEALANAKMLSWTLKPSFENVGKSILGEYTAAGTTTTTTTTQPA